MRACVCVRVRAELPRSFPSLLPLIGFIATAKLPSPPSLATHAIIPLPSQASLDQGTAQHIPCPPYSRLTDSVCIVVQGWA
jgi:hypothetical protein